MTNESQPIRKTIPLKEKPGQHAFKTIVEGSLFDGIDKPFVDEQTFMLREHDRPYSDFSHFLDGMHSIRELFVAPEETSCLYQYKVGQRFVHQAFREQQADENKNFVVPKKAIDAYWSGLLGLPESRRSIRLLCELTNTQRENLTPQKIAELARMKTVGYPFPEILANIVSGANYLAEEMLSSQPQLANAYKQVLGHKKIYARGFLLGMGDAYGPISQIPLL
ncbi:MAG: hypothetical protein COX79_01915 [Candidatus Levybacteria bacterium CG_4_10_14_0_2_um_filter_36_16]|nr:MAG: hypothetical protein AUK12_02655 [Candidatus Levybacteria bacterium CG2_30_37_29]PIZ97489.1 MAG: hypothetical protein COX79_01915 [Candidatus Levybacteria bacterium CG_4_10_14_0_2_um_filter_36_16]PJA90122.1 MAG: hypothetical protein CO136_03095 [Candidatus Levybacteria bacterium CG_4_9_14_3_um_filter_36_7]